VALLVDVDKAHSSHPRALIGGYNEPLEFPQDEKTYEIGPVTVPHFLYFVPEAAHELPFRQSLAILLGGHNRDLRVK
jgi:hypothetical protein